MPRDSLKFKFFLLLILLLFFSCVPKALAEPDSEKIRDLLLQSNIEEVINLFDKDYIKRKKWDLSEENSHYYAISLLVDGKIDELKVFLNSAQKKYPKSKNLENISNQIYYFTQEFDRVKPNPPADKHIKLIKNIENYKSGSDRQEAQIIDEINQVTNIIYFPTQMDYLLELNSPESLKQAETLAWLVINKSKTKLFPNTLDHYEVASAYKALAVSSVKSNDIKQATKYIKLARENIYKMRSIWLIEDIIINRPILKTQSRSTIFGFALPQWIMLLRDEYDNYLGL
jgi:hypothetical protein